MRLFERLLDFSTVPRRYQFELVKLSGAQRRKYITPIATPIETMVQRNLVGLIFLPSQPPSMSPINPTSTPAGEQIQSRCC